MATVGCGNPEVNDILDAAKKNYPAICALVNEVVSGMNHMDQTNPNKVEIMKKSETETENICDVNNAGTNIKSCESILKTDKTIDDVIRFRIISNVENYTENYISFSKGIQYKSDVSHNRTNFFTGEGGNPYIGINIKYTYNDYPFEVQFHTTQSSELATLLHPIYKSKEKLSIDDKITKAIQNAEGTAIAIKTIKSAENGTKSGKSRYKSRRKRKRKRKTYRKHSK